MTMVNSNVNDNILLAFRNTVFSKSGLKRGDFQKSLQEAIQDYIIQNSGKSNLLS